MKENLFIEQNKEKWIDFEEQLSKKEKDPEKLTSLFIQITDDLSYSRTYYPKRAVRYYLNYLAQRIYVKLFKRSKSGYNLFWRFWSTSLPRLAFELRKELLLSFLVYVLAVLIGVFSSIKDPDFPALILGEHYVEMTLENIENGDPMAVYKDSGESDMLVYITLNNVRVDFLTFISGIFLGIGSLMVILYNGIMVGAFQMFFFQQGIYKESLLAIWLHGTLELSAMIIAGAAGITLGKGMVFPGTLSRTQSFIINGRRATKLLLGIVPITMFAAIIESFFTRYTEAPDVLRLIVIIASAGFVIWYFVIYPFMVGRNKEIADLREAKIMDWTHAKFKTTEIYTIGTLIKEVFWFFQKHLFRLTSWSLLMAVPPTAMLFFEDTLTSEYLDEASYILSFTVVGIFTITTLYKGLHENTQKLMLKRKIASLFSLLVSMTVLVFLLSVNWALGVFSFLLLLAPLFLWNYRSLAKSGNIVTLFSESFSIYFKSYGKGLGLMVSMFIIAGFANLLVSSQLWSFYEDFVKLSLPIFKEYKTGYVLHTFFESFINNVSVQLVLISAGLFYYTAMEVSEANHLKTQIQKL